MCRLEGNCKHMGIPGLRFYRKEEGVYINDEAIRTTVHAQQAIGMKLKEILLSDSMERVLTLLGYNHTERTGKLKVITTISIAHPKDRRINDIITN